MEPAESQGHEGHPVEMYEINPFLSCLLIFHDIIILILCTSTCKGDAGTDGVPGRDGDDGQMGFPGVPVSGNFCVRLHHIY